MQEMERFREHEKEFKMKQNPRKGAFEGEDYVNNFIDSSDGDSYGDNSDNDHGDGDSDLNSNQESDVSNGDYDPEQLAKDKEWLSEFIKQKL
jgi:hypothetical protein